MSDIPYRPNPGGLGGNLAMGAFDALASPDPTKQALPYYGAQYISSDPDSSYYHEEAAKYIPHGQDGIWLNSEGHPLDAQSVAQLTAMNDRQREIAVNTPWQRPGFFGKMTPMGQGMESSDFSSIQYPGQQAQQQQAIQRSLIGNLNSTTLGGIGSARILGNAAQSNPNLIPLMSGLGAVNPQQVQAGVQAQTDLAANVPQNVTQAILAELDAKQRIAAAEAAAHPSAANPDISHTAVNAAQVGAGTSGAQVQALPSTQANIIRQETVGTPYSQYAQEWQATHPFAGGGALRTPLLNPNTGMDSTIRNPSMSLQGMMFNPNMFGGDGGTSSAPIQVPGVSRGVIVNTPQANQGTPSGVPPIGMSQSTSPTIGQLTLQPKTASPINGYPGAYADYTTGRVYYNGQDVSLNPNFVELKNAAIQQGQDLQDASHKSRQLGIDADVANLKAKKAANDHQHMQGKLMPLIGDAGVGLKNTYNQLITNPYRYWIGGQELQPDEQYNTKLGRALF